MYNSIREARKHLYQKLSSSADLASLATGGIIPISASYSESDRLALGPHVFYYSQSYQKEGFKRWRHRMIVEAVVPYGEYQLNGVTVDAYEYSEALQSAVLEALGLVEHGQGKMVFEVAGGLVTGEGFFVWQIIVETVTAGI